MEIRQSTAVTNRPTADENNSNDSGLIKRSSLAQEARSKKIRLMQQRFGARTDTFGVNHYYRTIDGEDRRAIIPACNHYGDPQKCLIAQRAGGCGQCTQRALLPLTEDWMAKHISGEKELSLYLLTADGIKFGASDFDFGEPFADALKVHDCSWAVGLPCYIARSSKKGYHLYWFFSQFIPAHLFTSLVRYFFEQAGFYERYHKNPEMTLPEIFPKQTDFYKDRFGSALKVPMLEPAMKNGFNCWVDRQAKPVELNKQWAFLAAAEEVPLSLLESAIEKNKIRIFSAPVSRGVSTSAGHQISGGSRHDPVKVGGDVDDLDSLVRSGCGAIALLLQRLRNNEPLCRLDRIKIFQLGASVGMSGDQIVDLFRHRNDFDPEICARNVAGLYSGFKRPACASMAAAGFCDGKCPAISKTRSRSPLGLIAWHLDGGVHE